jgi:hypothetical protein
MGQIEKEEAMGEAYCCLGKVKGMGICPGVRMDGSFIKVDTS